MPPSALSSFTAISTVGVVVSPRSITLKPHKAVKEDNDQIRPDIKAAIERAERDCVISNAIRGNVEIVVEEEVRS